MTLYPGSLSTMTTSTTHGDGDVIDLARERERRKLPPVVVIATEADEHTLAVKPPPDSCKDGHRHFVIDPDTRKVECRTCSAVVDAFDALTYFGERYEYFQKTQTNQAEIARARLSELQGELERLRAARDKAKREARKDEPVNRYGKPLRVIVKEQERTILRLSTIVEELRAQVKDAGGKPCA